MLTKCSSAVGAAAAEILPPNVAVPSIPMTDPVPSSTVTISTATEDSLQPNRASTRFKDKIGVSKTIVTEAPFPSSSTVEINP